MAFEQKIIWTALPNGIVNPPVGGPLLRLSIHIAPRLMITPGGGSTTLDKYPAWLDWPSHAQTFTVTVETGGQTEVIGATNVSDPPRSDIWTKLFGDATPVTSRDNVETFTDVPVVSYSPVNVLSFLRDQYVALAQSSPDEFPTYTDLISRFNDIGFGDQEGAKRLESKIAGLANERQQIVNGKPRRANSFASADPERDFVALREFHQPRGSKRMPRKPPELDFHQLISLAGEHPELLRILGLVYDVTVPTTTLPLGAPGPAIVSVVGSYPGTGAISPRTHAVLGSAVFEAAALGAHLAGRHLKIGDAAQFEVLQVDQDGAGLKASMLADNLQLSRAGKQTQDTPGSYSLPALRSGGLALARNERGRKFVLALDRADQLNSDLLSATANVYLDDLVKGYVLDVHDDASGEWRTPCLRSGKYKFPTASVEIDVTEEASISAPPTSSAVPGDPEQFNLQQSLVRWDGWSLAAPRPGLPITRKDDVTPLPPEGPPALPVQFDMQALELPRLRFGTKYAMRMRAVDIAGNAPPLGRSIPAVGDPAMRVTAESMYLRFEPVPSPDLESRSTPVQGESIARLVIRGNYNVDASEKSTRFVLPPRAAVLLCEQHGLFDAGAPGNNRPDVNAYGMIAARESAKYDPAQPIDTGAPVPFLPDPLSVGAALRVIGGGVFTDMRFGGWPDKHPFTLRIEHGAAFAVSQNDAGRELVIALGKADVVTVRLSSTITQDGLDLLGIHGWVKDAAAPSAAYLAAARAGQHWLTTPYRELTLVYAVRQPLAEPQLSNTAPQRGIGDTFATINGNLDFDHKSTGKLDMRAWFNEPVDDGPGAAAPSGPGAPTTTGRDVEVAAFEIRKTSALLQDKRFTGRHEFGDTRHRKVAYQTFATTKFTDNFVGTVSAAPIAGTPIPLSSIGLEPRSVSARSGDGSVKYSEGTDFSVDAAAGTVTFAQSLGNVQITFYPPVSRATPPLVRPDVDGPLTDHGRPILNIRSSARPAAPQIAFVIPIFQWSKITKSTTKTGTQIKSSRSPSALRVYLERPWWSSGVDEVLGVVTWIAESSGATIGKETAPYVSDWGRDPVFGSPALPSPHPKVSSFPASTVQGKGLTIEERAGVKVNVAGHAVAYDPDRQLWYCDIKVATGSSYMPIIRMALARYQPNSLSGVELSRIVLADFMSLAPGRAVTVVPGRGSVSVTLTGRSYSKAAKSISGPGYAQVIVEKRDSGVPDPVLGWKQVGKPHPMTHVKAGRGVGSAWTASQIKIPSGEVRLVIEQYEELPVDKRGPALIGPVVGRRLIYSDVVPLKPRA